MSGGLNLRTASDPWRSQTERHSITSSARASNSGGTVRSSAFAVLRLITSSTLVLCWMGRSAEFAPRRIFSGIDPCLLVQIRHATSVAHQTTDNGKNPEWIDRGHGMLGCQLNELVAPGDEKRVCHYHESADPTLNHDRKRRVELVFRTSTEQLQTLLKSVGRSQNGRNGRLEVRIIR